MKQHGLAVNISPEHLPGIDKDSGTVTKDPFDQTKSIRFKLADPAKKVQGSLILRESGQVYCEIDVLLADPNNPKVCIESVVIWGKSQSLKSELKYFEYSEIV